MRILDTYVFFLLLISTVSSDVVQYENETIGLLSCWVCYTTNQNDACFNLTQSQRKDDMWQHCAPHQRFCKVERIWYEIGMNKEAYNFSIKRNCSSNCDPYCLIMGDRTKIFACSSCCQSSLCNTGSGSEKTAVCKSYSTLVFAVLICLSSTASNVFS